MMESLDPGLMRDLTEAKADLARHGIVIVRTLETELTPAIVSGAKSSMASSPKSMSKMDEWQLDAYLEKLRKASEKSSGQLRDLYVRLLAKLGSGDLEELSKELDGIEQLIKWERIAKAVDPVNEKLTEKGFGPVELASPEDLSESLKVELEQKWPASFDRFKTLVREAVAQMALSDLAETDKTKTRGSRKTPRRG